MIENWNYIADEELEHLINQVEQEELVAAPPDLLENILNAEPEISHLIHAEVTYVPEEAAKRILNICFAEAQVAAEPEILSTEGSVIEAIEVAEESKVLSTASPMITNIEITGKMKDASTAQTRTLSMTAVRKKEFYSYCFRVITSVAAAVALVFLLPELTNRIHLNGTATQKYYSKNAIVQNGPSYDKVLIPSPSKAEVIEGNTIPSKAEVTADRSLSSESKIVEGNTTPNKEEVISFKTIPSKENIISSGKVPSKDEVLNNTGFVENIMKSNGWFDKSNNEKHSGAGQK